MHHTRFKYHHKDIYSADTDVETAKPRGEPLPARIRENPPHVVLAADCVYFEPAFPLLQATLGELLALRPARPGTPPNRNEKEEEEEGVVVYFCFKKRRRADMQFLKVARRRFRVTEVEDVDRPVWSRQGLFLFKFTAKEKGLGMEKVKEMGDGGAEGGEGAATLSTGT